MAINEKIEKSGARTEIPEVVDSKEKIRGNIRPGGEKAEERKVGVAEERVVEKPEEIEEIKKRIVVVDSKEKTLDEAIKALRKGEYYVIGVETAEEFFEVTKSKATANETPDIKAVTPETYWDITKAQLPDLLITDLDIRDLDGWEFIFRIKFDNRYYEYWTIPIIVRTDEQITVETVKKLQAESIYDYFPKKIKGKELLQKIDKFFETKEKLSETKKEITDNIGSVVAKEYERIFLAARIRLKYIHALKVKLEELRLVGGDPQEIKNLQDVIYLQNRDVIKYERRKLEIKKTLKKKKKVKEDERGAEDRANVKAEAD
jgi:DNA-binding response OmpR family regulator